MKSLRTYFYRAAAWFGVDLNWALEMAAVTGDTETVKTMLEAGADIHAWDDAPLRKAARWGHTATVRLLLEAGANPHAKNDDALGVASAFGYKETARLLEAWMAREESSTDAKTNGAAQPEIGPPAP